MINLNCFDLESMRLIMKKWDTLSFHAKESVIYFNSTTPDGLKIIVDKLNDEFPKYFSYLTDAGKHKLKIESLKSSIKGHCTFIIFSPIREKIYIDNIEHTDFFNFLLNIIISDGWLPYPGNGNATRFIKYYE